MYKSEQNGDGQITYICILSFSCLGSVHTSPGQPWQPVITPRPCRDREWLWGQAKERDLHIQCWGQGGEGGSWASGRVRLGWAPTPAGPLLIC